MSNKMKEIKFVIISIEYGLLASNVLQHHPSLVQRMKNLDILRIRTIDGYMCDVLLWTPNSIEEIMDLVDNTDDSPLVINRGTPMNWINEKRDYELNTIQIFEQQQDTAIVYPAEEEEGEIENE
jgi:hypothetical protein